MNTRHRRRGAVRTGKGTNRTVYFQHDDLPMVERLDRLVEEGTISNFSTYVQEAVREKFRRENRKR